MRGFQEVLARDAVGNSLPTAPSPAAIIHDWLYEQTATLVRNAIANLLANATSCDQPPQKTPTPVVLRSEDGTGWLPSKNSSICSKHSVGNVKANEEGHISYHPSIFPSIYKNKQTPGSSRRFERQMEREKKKAAGKYQDPAPHPDSSVPAIDYSAEQANEIAPMECSLVDASTMTEDQP
ncbi:hypothetical protein V5799_027252, partial [Amblyomma americanum]